MDQKSLSGSFHLFRLFGIDVYLHWAWFLMVVWLMQTGGDDNKAWNLAIALAVFAIVLMHEFGHALACRSVGGEAKRIVLWPLGGVAFVAPPPRPGAVLWSIAAGPLVNVILAPVLIFGAVAASTGLGATAPAAIFLERMARINIVILVFNMMPVYPLDGGQIFQSILWFFVGRATSLRIAAVFGFVAAVAGGIFALSIDNMWLVVIAVFIGMQAFSGYRVARYLAAQERAFELPPP